MALLRGSGVLVFRIQGDFGANYKDIDNYGNAASPDDFGQDGIAKQRAQDAVCHVENFRVVS